MNQCDRQAETQPLARQETMREVNLAIFEIGSRLSDVDDWYTFLCECSDVECTLTLRLQLHRFDPSMPAGSLVAHVPDGEREPLT